MNDDEEITLHHIDAYVCELCLAGVGAECHVPGCSFWLRPVPRYAEASVLRLLATDTKKRADA